MENKNVFRQLSDREKGLLNRLFEFDFIGRDQLVQQLPNLLAKRIQETGTLEFQVQDEAARAPVDGCIIEASCKDADTTEFNPAQIIVLLHVKHGKLWLLEIYKENNAPIHNVPNADALANIFMTHPSK